MRRRSMATNSASAKISPGTTGHELPLDHAEACGYCVLLAHVPGLIFALALFVGSSCPVGVAPSVLCIIAISWPGICAILAGELSIIPCRSLWLLRAVSPCPRADFRAGAVRRHAPAAHSPAGFSPGISG
jgi:hypothetical protein